MGRKNHRRSSAQARRSTAAVPKVRRASTPPPPPVSELVVPRGRCYFGSRQGKLRFAAADVERALAQARANRARRGSSYAEERAYPCPDGGCGDWHLTSRKTWTEKKL